MERDRRVALVHGRYRPSETRTGWVVGSSPGGARVASSRGLAQPPGWIELAGADPGVHGVDDVRAQSDPRSSPGTKKRDEPGTSKASFPLSSGHVPIGTQSGTACAAAGVGTFGRSAVVTGGAIRVVTTLPRARV